MCLNVNNRKISTWFQNQNTLERKHDFFNIPIGTFFPRFMSHIITLLTCNQDKYGHKSARGPAHVRFDRGNDHSGEPQDWKKWPQYLEKRTEERMSNIFSPNYSVGTVLCTVECPGSGMAWWVKTGAKPRPPHIVLSVDFPHSLVPIYRTSALPLPSWLGQATARFLPQSPSARDETVRICKSGLVQGQFLAMPQLLDCQCLDYLFKISVFFLLIQSGWKISQPGKNLSSCKVSELLCLCVLLLWDILDASASCTKASSSEHNMRKH